MLGILQSLKASIDAAGTRLAAKDGVVVVCERETQRTRWKPPAWGDRTPAKPEGDECKTFSKFAKVKRPSWDASESGILTSGSLHQEWTFFASIFAVSVIKDKIRSLAGCRGRALSYLQY